jgi:hypothetical protein
LLLTDDVGEDVATTALDELDGLPLELNERRASPPDTFR